jgi:hypothetical protein
MKKVLLSIMTSALLVVGCQDYDDQFSSLESQISALATTVAGLSQVQSDLASLAGTVGSLATTVNGLGDQIDTAVSDGLSDIQSDIDAINTAVADVASSEDVSSLSDAVDAAQSDLTDLLAASSVFTGSVVVNSVSTLDVFHKMGAGLAIVNGSVNITVNSEMDLVKVQELVDNILTITGHYQYSSAESTIAEVTFNKLTGTQSLTVKQAGGYNFQALTSATVITLDQSFESKVKVIHFGALTSVTRFFTGTATDTIDFSSAEELHLTSLPRYNPNTLTINIDEGAVLAMGVIDDVDSEGDQQDLALNITGPKSVSFANLYDGSISLTDVDTATISGFTGTITINSGVETLSITDGVTVSLTGATDLVTASVDLKLDDDPSLTTAATAADGGDIDVTGLTDLTDLTISGDVGDVTVSGNSNLLNLTITADMDDLTINDSDDLENVTVTGAEIHDITVTGNGDLASLTLDHEVALDSSGTTAQTGAMVNISTNAKLASVTYSADKVDHLNVATNAKLTTVDFTGLALIGSTSATVNITGNKFTATKAKDDYNLATAADAGSFTTTSGMGTLQTYLDAAAAAPGTGGVKAYFDVIEVTETQAASEGDYTENASYTVDQTSATNLAAIVNITASVTTGITVNQAISAVFPVKRNTFRNDVDLATGEGIIVAISSTQSVTFKKGDVNGAVTVATVDQLVDYINADTTITGAGFALTAARDAWESHRYAITWTYSNGIAAVTSATGDIWYTFGTNPLNGNTISGALTLGGALEGHVNIAADMATAINALTSPWVASSSSNVLVITANVSGTGDRDLSPLALTPGTLAFDSSTDSTTLKLAGNFATYIAGATASEALSASSNTLAVASSLFSLSVAKTTENGVRVTLSQNNNGAVMNAGASITMTSFSGTLVAEGTAAIASFTTVKEIDGAGNGASGNGGNGTDDYGVGTPLVGGANIPTSANNSSTLDYVSGFSDIESPVTATGNSTDRTGWLPTS